MPTYIEDLTGALPANRVQNEVHPVNSVVTSTHKTIVPDYAPFFADGFVMHHVSTGGVVTPMVNGVDYALSMEFNSASNSLGLMVYGGVTLLDNRVDGNYRLTSYQTIGGNWLANPASVLALLTGYAYNPRTIFYEQIVNLPVAFPPDLHTNHTSDVSRVGDIIEVLNTIAAQLADGSNLTNHATSLSPHMEARLTDDQRIALKSALQGNVYDSFNSDVKSKLVDADDIVNISSYIVSTLGSAVSGDIGDHNSSAGSHLDIRNLITSVSNALTAHNTAGSAHTALFNTKANLNSPTFTGTPTSTTPANSDSSTRIATTAFVKAVLPDISAKADVNSPTLSGTPTAPTPLSTDNSTRLATTAFIRNAVDTLASATAKIITQETVFHVKHAPGTGEFSSLADAWNHLRTFYIREKTIIQIEAGSYQSGKLHLDGIKPNAEIVPSFTSSYTEGEHDRNLVWIIGGNGINSDQVVINHDPSKHHEDFVTVTDSNICLTGVTFSGRHRGIGYFDDSLSFNLSAPAYTNNVMACTDSIILVGGSSVHRNARKRYLPADTAAIGQPVENQLMISKAMDSGLTLRNGVRSFNAVSTVVYGDCIEARDYGHTGVTIGKGASLNLEVIMTFGYRKSWDSANVNSNYTYAYTGKSESNSDKIFRQRLQETPDSTSDLVAIVGLGAYGGQISVRCVRSDNNTHAMVSADSGYMYLLASNRNGRYVESKYGNTLPTYINSAWICGLTSNGGVLYIDTHDYAIQHGVFGNIDMVNNPNQAILYTNPETQATTSLSAFVSGAGLPRNTIRVRPGGIMFYSDGGSVRFAGRFTVGVTYKFLRGDATGYQSLEASIAHTIDVNSSIRVLTHGVHAGYADTTNTAVQIDNTDKLRRIHFWTERYSTRTAKFKGVAQHVFGGVARVGYYHGHELTDAYNCVGDKSASELAFSSSGYSTSPTGLVFQWGEFTTTGIPQAYHITFPIAFEKKVLLVQQLDLLNYVGEIAWIGDYNKTNTGFSMEVPYQTAVRTIRWLAIGV